MPEACFCGRVGEIEDREPVSLDGGERVVRCEWGHLERVAWLSGESRKAVFEEAEQRKPSRGRRDAGSRMPHSRRSGDGMGADGKVDDINRCAGYDTVTFDEGVDVADTNCENQPPVV